ncbi:MAG: deoxyribonuclease HsdR [Bacteroidetes bacterium]|nr:MAG: deoxyribonuclease HsdR [Bacteroidota bacterium]
MKRFIGLFTVAALASLMTITVYKIYEDQPVPIISSVNFNEPAPPVSYQFTNLKSTPERTIDFTSAAERTVNTVVHVKTVFAGETYRHFDPFYEFLWGKGKSKKQYEYRGPERHGSGSGVILSQDGYIVTNNHVIKGAKEVEITLNDRRTYRATVIGTDPSTDLSLLKIEANDLPYIAYGNSDLVKIGEWALAVGNPYNLTSTVTAGIVSAKGRNIDILRDKFKIESFIQTDAAVNPGNSGGALVNTRGELIGINSAIASPTGSYSGYSFAIPVNIVAKVVNDLKEFGKVQRAFIGISIRNVDAKLAEEKGLKDISGIYISGISHNGAARAAGMKEGDIIIKVESKGVNNVPELQEQIGSFRPGDKVNITFRRNGEVKTAKLVLKNQFGRTELSVNNTTEASSYGAKFKTLSAAHKAKLGLENGVQITELESGKLKNAGIRKGFIVIKIDKKKITSTADLVTALKNKKGGILLEGVYPNGAKAYYGFGI